MRCLSRIEIQEFIDNEVNPGRERDIQSHLKHCEKCSILYRTALNDKDTITRFLSDGIPLDENTSIPEFQLRVIKRKRTDYVRMISLITAASLIGCILLYRLDRKPLSEKIPKAEIILYDYIDGKDLNKLWHNKSHIVILDDEKGDVIQSVITY